jgi:hypothetical protein
MLPVSTKDIHRVAPDGDGGPVYLIATPTVLQRAAWRRDVAATGARFPSEADLHKALVDDLSAAAPDNLEEILACVNAVRDTPEDQRDPDLVEKYEAVAAFARRHGGAYARLQADRGYWADVAPIVALRSFLVGWEGLAVPFSKDLVDDIPEDHQRVVGWEAINRMRLSEDARKNFVSPSPSP